MEIYNISNPGTATDWFSISDILAIDEVETKMNFKFFSV